jgi:hypothetical protein
METRAGDTQGQFLLRLAVVGAVACVALGIAFGYSVRGYGIDLLGVFALGLLAVALLSPLFIAALVHLVKELRRRRFRLTMFLPPIVIVVGMILGGATSLFVTALVPYRPEKVFWSHHEEFVELAEWASAECSHGRYPDPPPAPFYEEAWADCGASGLEEIEFTIRRAGQDVLLTPVVYVVFSPAESTGDAYDPCDKPCQRYFVKKIEDHWYLCAWTTD